MPEGNNGAVSFLPTHFSPLLRSYFRSGWAFLIPYLAAYLLYAWLKWPVNPAAGGEGMVKGISESGAGASGLGSGGSSLLLSPPSIIPSLLHVYWFLHALHLLLGGIALVTWWRCACDEHGARSAELGSVSSAFRSPFFVLQTAAPWILLGLLFWIPGIYLEFPADPWEHYRRGNEWSWRETVDEHQAGTKASYFLAYSLIGGVKPALNQFVCFDLYAAACCLLLCWQYYRLGRAASLGGQDAMIFVILQALLFGNNLFGFYRYYGMSSTVFAQLGAMALLRLTLETAVSPARGTGQESESITPVAIATEKRCWRVFGLWVAKLLAAGALLLTLVANNHPQGIGLTLLGVAAVVAWRLIEWRKSMGLWLALAAAGLSLATILWYPQPSALRETYVEPGWLNAWFGFNLFSPASPAFNRAGAILGLTGLINLIAGLLLLRRNHVAAWLTLMPVIALCLPCVTIPFVVQLMHHYEPALVYHRMFLAIPAGLALVVLGTSWVQRAKDRQNSSPAPQGQTTTLAINGPAQVAFTMLLATLLTLTATPVKGPFFNRFYNALMRPPNDLGMKHVLAATAELDLKTTGPGRSPVFIAPTGVFFVTQATGFGRTAYVERLIHSSSIERIALAQSLLTTAVKDRLPAVFLPPSAHELYTPHSLTGALSKHWLPQEVTLEHAGGPELEQMARVLGYKKIELNGLTYYAYWPQ